MEARVLFHCGVLCVPRWLSRCYQDWGVEKEIKDQKVKETLGQDSFRHHSLLCCCRAGCCYFFPAQLEKHSTQKFSPPSAQRDSYEGSLFPGGGKLKNLRPSVSLAWLLLLQTRDSDLAWAQESSPCWGAQLFSFASPQMLRGMVGFDGRRVTSSVQSDVSLGEEGREREQEEREGFVSSSSACPLHSGQSSGIHLPASGSR